MSPNDDRPSHRPLASLFRQIPSGPNVLWSSFGANQGKADPGMKVCWPVWNYVNAMVSKQAITYNAVPKNCPTKDNVMVNGKRPRARQRYVGSLPFLPRRVAS